MTRRNEQDTAAHFLLSQADRLHVAQVQMQDGSWGMALVFDPGYAQPSRGMVDYYRRRIARIIRHEQELADGRIRVHQAKTDRAPEMRPDRDGRPGGGADGPARPGDPEARSDD